MPGDFQSSFIPKEPVKKRRKRRASSGSLTGLVTVIIVVLVIVATIGAFVYEKFLESRLDAKIEELRQVEEKLDTALIEELVSLDKRLNASVGLLNDHVALSNLFSELERETSHAIRFTSLDFDYDDIAGEHTLAMNGQARDLNAVAHQSDVFGENRMFNDVVFSGLAVEDEESGVVNFRFTATVDSELIDYEVSGQGQ